MCKGCAKPNDLKPADLVALEAPGAVLIEAHPLVHVHLCFASATLRCALFQRRTIILTDALSSSKPQAGPPAAKQYPGCGHSLTTAGLAAVVAAIRPRSSQAQCHRPIDRRHQFLG